MLLVLLTILKIVGCIILALLAILLLVLLLVLFVPLRYRVKGGKNAEIHADAHVTWLLHAVHLSAEYNRKLKEAPLHLKLKILGLTLFDNQKKGGKEPEIEVPLPQTGSGEQKEKEPETQGKPPETDEQARPEETERPKQAQKPKEKEKTATEAKKKKEKKKTSESMQSSSEGPGDKLEQLQVKLEKLGRKKEKLICLFDNPKNRSWLDKTLFRLKKLILYLIPDIRRLYLHFGFDDPSLTGRCLGGLSLLYPVCEDRMELVPEFDRQILEGEAEAGGVIRLYRFLVFAVPVFLNPQFFKIFKKVKCIIK